MVVANPCVTDAVPEYCAKTLVDNNQKKTNFFMIYFNKQVTIFVKLSIVIVQIYLTINFLVTTELEN